MSYLIVFDGESVPEVLSALLETRADVRDGLHSQTRKARLTGRKSIEFSRVRSGRPLVVSSIFEFQSRRVVYATLAQAQVNCV